jgi:hypothetical protein
VPTPGLYQVRVTVSSSSRESNRVKLTIGYYGAFQRHSVTAVRSHHARLSIRLRIVGGSFTVSAVGQRRPTLAISIHRLARLTPTPSAATPKPTTPTTPTTPTAPATGGTPPPTPTATGVLPPPPIQTWVPSNSVNFTPLPDSVAAQNVIAAPETRPSNAAANSYLPSSAELQSFYGATDHWGRNIVAVDPYYKYVTGHFSGTTDEIIQWAAWKWGIPEDWLRAEYSQESMWKQAALGDKKAVTAGDYALYPPQARIPNTLDVYQSMGLTQVKWTPNGSVGAGTEPMRWTSTAFNVDYQLASIRYLFDNPQGLASANETSNYFSGNGWDSLGGWFSYYPWVNSGQMNYINAVQGRLSVRTWAQPGF